MSRLRILPLLVLAVAALAAPAAASARSVNVPAVLGDQLTALTEESPLAVLLPETLPLDIDASIKVYSSVDASSPKRWSVTLAGAKDCGANVCFLASISAEKGAKRFNSVRVRLIRGINGWYRPLSCGGSCSPPSIEWTVKGVLYEIQAKVAQKGRTDKAILAKAANSAIHAGPR